MFFSAISYLLLLLLLLLHSAITAAAKPPAIGVTYSPTVGRRVSLRHLPATLSSLNLDSLHLQHPDPSVVRAFANSNTSLLLTLPNSAVRTVATDRSAALRWLYRHLVPFYPRTHVTTISVGTDILQTPSDLIDHLLPAIHNLHQCLQDIGIHDISVSTTFSFINTMTTSFPPSSAEFQQPAADIIMKPLLQFLDHTNSSFLINLYPYDVYRLHSEIPLAFALFQDAPFNFRDDATTGVRYRNLFDMMSDAVISAMTAAGHENIPVVVAETGWPSTGGQNEGDANKEYAEMYLRGLVRHLRSGVGTPLRKEGVAGAFIFELFDTEMAAGDLGAGSVGGGRQWGILYPNMTRKYKLEFSFSERSRRGCGVWILAAVVFLFFAGR